MGRRLALAIPMNERLLVAVARSRAAVRFRPITAHQDMSASPDPPPETGLAESHPRTNPLRGRALRVAAEVNDERGGGVSGAA